jgi:hypothetical protein
MGESSESSKRQDAFYRYYYTSAKGFEDDDIFIPTFSDNNGFTSNSASTDPSNALSRRVVNPYQSYKIHTPVIGPPLSRPLPGLIVPLQNTEMPSMRTDSQDNNGGSGNEVATDESYNRKQSALSLPTWSATSTSDSPNSLMALNATQTIAPLGHQAVAKEQVSDEVLEIANKITIEQLRIQRQYGPGSIQFFHPSQAVLQKTGLITPNAQQRLLSAAAPNAITRVESQNLASPESSKPLMGHDVPLEESCSIFVRNIPARATYKDFLSSVKGGKVFICRIDPPNGEFQTQAAKLVFFNRLAASAYLWEVAHRGVVVLGQPLRASWNRVRYAQHLHSNQSRVIMIIGPENLMSFDYFEQFFSERFQYDLQARFEVRSDIPGTKIHIWQFACLRAQAESAKLAIEREFVGIFKVQWAPDPCDVPWTP